MNTDVMARDWKVLQTGHNERYDGHPVCQILFIGLQILYLDTVDILFQLFLFSFYGHKGLWNINPSMEIF